MKTICRSRRCETFLNIIFKRCCNNLLHVDHNTFFTTNYTDCYFPNRDPSNHFQSYTIQLLYNLSGASNNNKINVVIT